MRSPALVMGSIVTALLVSSCGNAAERSAERFCGELAAHATEIKTVPTTEREVASFITLFSKMGEVAPLDIQDDWEAVYNTLKAASAVDGTDPAANQAVADAAYKSQQSAERVVEWAKATCGVDLGPVAFVPGGADVIVTTTTVPEAPGSTGG